MKIRNLQLWDNLKKKGERVLVKGAPMVVAGVIAVSVLCPVTAHAYVKGENIVRDEDYYTMYQRDEIRSNDVAVIDQMFTQDVTIDEVLAAIEVSDAINSYYPGPNQYINTNLEEVTSLDVLDLKDDLNRAQNRNKDKSYCKSLRDEMAAVDAYTLFGNRTVTYNIEKLVCAKVTQLFQGYGMNVKECKLYIGEDYAFALVSNDKEVCKVNLTGEFFEQLKSLYLTMNGKYMMAIKDMKGIETETENSFCYNGVNVEDGQSAWLSIGDDERKAILRDGIMYLSLLEEDESIGYDCPDLYSRNKCDKSEVQMLKDLGYTKQQINKNKEFTLEMSRVMTYTR